MQNASYARKRYQTDEVHRKAKLEAQNARRARLLADPLYREIERLRRLIESRRDMIEGYQRKNKKADRELVEFTLEREKLLKIWEATQKAGKSESGNLYTTSHDGAGETTDLPRG